MRFLIGLSLLVLLGTSCNKETKYSNIPKISFLNISPSSIQAGGDSIVIIKFNFEDGDGNIGFGTPNIYVKDSRDSSEITFLIPGIPSKFTPENGLKGIIQIEYEAAFLLLRTDSLHMHTDTLHWSIYMKDAAGNPSNVITTSELILTK